MAVRPIDANELYRIEKLLDTDIVRQDKVALNLLEQVLYDIQHVPTLTQPNEPLTLDDLRKIDTVAPLWVHDLSWGRHKPRLMLVRYVASRYWSCVDFDGFEIVKADDYGSRYLIYRRPPEGEEEEKHVIEITENL